MGNLYMLCPDNLYQVIKLSAYSNANKAQFQKIDESKDTTPKEKEEEAKKELERLVKHDDVQIHRAGRFYFSMWFVFTCQNKQLATKHMSTDTYHYLVRNMAVAEESYASKIVDFFTPKFISEFLGTVGSNNYTYDETKINKIQKEFLDAQLKKIQEDKKSKTKGEEKVKSFAQTLAPGVIGFRVVPSPLLSDWWLIHNYDKALSDLPAQELDTPTQKALYQNYLNPKATKPTFINPVLL